MDMTITYYNYFRFEIFTSRSFFKEVVHNKVLASNCIIPLGWNVSKEYLHHFAKLILSNML